MTPGWGLLVGLLLLCGLSWVGEWDVVTQKGSVAQGWWHGGCEVPHGGGECDMQESGPLRVTRSRVAWRGRA